VLVTGWLRSISGIWSSPPPARRLMVSKNAGMPSGFIPELARIPKPTRSASVSLARVKLICC
jgi:hypothetical protein